MGAHRMPRPNLICEGPPVGEVRILLYRYEGTGGKGRRRAAVGDDMAAVCHAPGLILSGLGVDLRSAPSTPRYD
jgi:hypothetical protein